MIKSFDHLIEHPVKADVLLEGGFLNVRRDTVRLPNGHTATREFIVHQGAVAIIPLLDDGRAVLVRQYRYPLSTMMLEFPAGKIDPGELTLNCGKRELAEETGYSAKEWAPAVRLHNAAAYSSEGIDLWFARGLKSGRQRLDDGEFLEVEVHSLDDLETMARDGLLTDAKTLIGLLWWRQWREGRWPLTWSVQG